MGELFDIQLFPKRKETLFVSSHELEKRLARLVAAEENDDAAAQLACSIVLLDKKERQKCDMQLDAQKFESEALVSFLDPRRYAAGMLAERQELWFVVERKYEALRCGDQPAAYKLAQCFAYGLDAVLVSEPGAYKLAQAFLFGLRAGEFRIRIVSSAREGV